MTSEQAVATAVLAVLNEALDPKAAYEVDAIPEPRPSEYVEVQVTRRFGGVMRSCGTKATTGWRVSVFGISQMYVGNARDLLQKCNTALEFARLDVDGEQSTPVQFETADAVKPDDGWFSGWRDYTLTI